MGPLVTLRRAECQAVKLARRSRRRGSGPIDPLQRWIVFLQKRQRAHATCPDEYADGHEVRVVCGFSPKEGSLAQGESHRFEGASERRNVCAPLPMGCFEH